HVRLPGKGPATNLAGERAFRRRPEDLPGTGVANDSVQQVFEFVPGALEPPSVGDPEDRDHSAAQHSEDAQPHWNRRHPQAANAGSGPAQRRTDAAHSAAETKSD